MYMRLSFFSTENTQISILRLCSLYLFDEFMITMYESILFKTKVFVSQSDACTNDLPLWRARLHRQEMILNCRIKQAVERAVCFDSACRLADSDLSFKSRRHVTWFSSPGQSSLLRGR